MWFSCKNKHQFPECFFTATSVLRTASVFYKSLLDAAKAWNPGSCHWMCSLFFPLLQQLVKFLLDSADFFLSLGQCAMLIQRWSIEMMVNWNNRSRQCWALYKVHHPLLRPKFHKRRRALRFAILFKHISKYQILSWQWKHNLFKNSLMNLFAHSILNSVETNSMIGWSASWPSCSHLYGLMLEVDNEDHIKCIWNDIRNVSQNSHRTRTLIRPTKSLFFIHHLSITGVFLPISYKKFVFSKMWEFRAGLLSISSANCTWHLIVHRVTAESDIRVKSWEMSIKSIVFSARMNNVFLNTLVGRSGLSREKIKKNKPPLNLPIFKTCEA